MNDFKINNKALEFVSDWRARTEKQQRKYFILSSIAFLMALVICVILFFWFQNRNYERIVNQNMKYIQDSTIQEANHIERELVNARELITNFSKQYANLVVLEEGASVEDRLKLLGDKNIFDRLAFIDNDGLDISLEGTADVSDREYFKKAMSGETGWEMVEKSRVTGKPTLIFFAPVMINNRINGVMAGFYDNKRLEELFSYQLFNYTPNSYILNSDGVVVANSKGESISDNMLERLSKKTYTGDVDYKEIEEVIHDSERTTVNFSFVDNRATSVGVIVQFSASDWMVLSVLPHDVTGGMVSNANRIGVVLVVVIVVMFIILTIVLLVFFRLQRERLENEMSVATEGLEDSVRDEQKQISIIESVGNIYSSIYYVDMAERRYLRIKDFRVAGDTTPIEGPAKEGFGGYVDKYVDDAYKEDMYEFLNVDTFRPRLEKNKVESIEYKRSDGGWRRGTIIASEYDEKGFITSVVFVVQKIDTEKEKELKAKAALQDAYEAARIASNAKTSFLSNMSHDIRTPMNAIVGMTAIAAANLDNRDKVSDCLKKITSSSKHLLGLINEVLDMSKIESGKVDLNEEEFRLSDLIDNLISINQPAVKEKNHTLLVKINKVVHEDVVGDSTRLQQVLTNLLSNAIKYTPEGGRIEFIVSEKDTHKKSVGLYEVIVKDNGIGMSEEFQKNIFEPFSRADDERINGIQGTGLGMSITKNIIRMMNGDISVSSGINQGTTFTLSFSLRLQTMKEADYDAFVDLPVLVVDDDVVACESTCTILNSLSMDSEWVNSGKEAVEKTAEHHEQDNDYYAVIVDWKMPDMNGIETTREIRKCVGDSVPIIVMSAYDWTDIEPEARAAGVNAFLSKPLFKSRLVGLFNELLGKNPPAEFSGQSVDISEHDFSGKRILVVEDNDINAEITCELLSMCGVETEIAENGKVAVEKFTDSEKGYYDLIFMDIQMPVMNGYDATMAIRALSHPDAKKVPIIAMTANAFSSDVRQALNSGMNSHIAKPIDTGRIVKVMNDFLGNN